MAAQVDQQHTHIPANQPGMHTAAEAAAAGHGSGTYVRSALQQCVTGERLCPPFAKAYATSARHVQYDDHVCCFVAAPCGIPYLLVLAAASWASFLLNERLHSSKHIRQHTNSFQANCLYIRWQQQVHMQQPVLIHTTAIAYKYDGNCLYI
jgi:hypothetical protein